MRHLGRSRHLEASRGLAQITTGSSQSRAHPEVVHPGIDNEGLDESARVLGILEDSPPRCAVTAALAAKLLQRREESLSLLRLDLVLRCHQDGATPPFDMTRQDCRWPI